MKEQVDYNVIFDEYNQLMEKLVKAYDLTNDEIFKHQFQEVSRLRTALRFYCLKDPCRSVPTDQRS